MTPAKYRQVINPHQTRSEIRAQVKFLDKMLAAGQYTETQLIELLLLDKPDWKW